MVAMGIDGNAGARLLALASASSGGTRASVEGKSCAVSSTWGSLVVGLVGSRLIGGGSCGSASPSIVRFVEGVLTRRRYEDDALRVRVTHEPSNIGSEA